MGGGSRRTVAEFTDDDGREKRGRWGGNERLPSLRGGAAWHQGDDIGADRRGRQ